MLSTMKSEYLFVISLFVSVASNSILILLYGLVYYKVLKQVNTKSRRRYLKYLTLFHISGKEASSYD